MQRLALPFAAVVWFILAGAQTSPVAAAPIAIADVKHDGPVDFEKEILPILRKNCLACHNASDAESDLVLETPATIKKGGALGPGVVPGKSDDSLLLQVAAHQEEPIMPPAKNDRGAKNLTPQELGLIKLWIDQGAEGTVSGSGPIAWQPLPPGVNPIYAAALTGDGRWAAAGRANQIFLYHVPSKRDLGRLTDPALIESGMYSQPGVAHLDLVQSLAFNPQGDLLASGGYRTIKLWRRVGDQKLAELSGLDAAARAVATSADGRWLAVGQENGQVKLYDLSGDNKAPARSLAAHEGPVRGVAFSADGARLATGGDDKHVKLWSTGDGAELAKLETPAAVLSLAVLPESNNVATGGGDNVIRVWRDPLADDAPKPTEEAPQIAPLRELKGHGGPVAVMHLVPGQATHIVTGGHDGQIRFWDTNADNSYRQVNASGQISALAVRPDGQRVVVAAGSQSVRLYDANNGQQVAELKGHFGKQLAAEAAARDVQLAKRLTDNHKKDLDDANKRKTQEDDNEKKSKEALTKAEGEFKQKQEAMKKPVADKEAADKELETAKADLAKADEAKQAEEKKQQEAGEAVKQAQAARDEANKQLADADAALKAAQEKLKQAQDAANGDAENQALKDAVAAAEKEQQAAEAKRKEADENKAAKEKAVADAEAAKREADQAKQKADQAFNDANNKHTQADNKVKQLAAPAQKAIDEFNSAERAMQAAQRSVERAAESVKAAVEAIPVAEKALKEAEEHGKQAEMAQQAAQQEVGAAEKPILGVAFSPDGQLIATVGENQLVHTWSGENGQPIDALAGHAAPLTHAAFTADGRLVSVAQNNQALIWRAEAEWKLERTIGSIDDGDTLVDRVTALAFSPDGKMLASGGGEPSRSGELKIWSVDNGQLVREFTDAHSDTVFDVQFSPDGLWIASCGADRFAKVFEVQNGKFVRAFEGHTHHVMGVAWRCDGRVLATSGADNVVKVWDARTGDQRRTVQGFGKEVTGIEFVGLSDNFLAGAGDRAARIKNAENGNNVRDFGGASDFVYAVAASQDGKLILAGGQDSVLRIWQENGQTWVNFEPPAAPEQTAAAGQ